MSKKIIQNTGTKLTYTLNGIDKQSAAMVLEGELTIYDTKLTKNNLLNALKEYNNIELDLSRITKLDSSGFQLLVACTNVVDSKNHKPAIVFKSPSDNVREVFQQFGETI